MTRESRSNIQRKLGDINNTDYFIIKTIPWSQKNFIQIGNKIYEGYQSIVDAGLARSVQAVSRAVRSGKAPWDKNKNLSWHKLSRKEMDAYLIAKVMKGHSN